ncbi:hypothetical protein G6F61_014963 [Rhizopus arrhizus]|nr:hypothetical protein G6F61_014963 [Rhizopus arrhizus]
MAPRFPPASGAVQPRGAHLGRGRQAPACDGPEAEDRHRPSRRGGDHRRRQAGPEDRAARGHGCVAGDRADRPAVRLQGHRPVPRPDRGRDACLRP